jgi:membrane protein
VTTGTSPVGGRTALALRPRPPVVWGTIKDYARRVWDNAADDDVLFLASAVAFNILLAAVPLLLLLLAALGYWLNHSQIQSRAEVWAFIEALLPPHVETADSPYHRVIDEIIRTRRSVGAISAVFFIWFTTRLFGSLRAALANVFDVRERRSILGGKAYDLALTAIATALFMGYTGVSAYLKLATSRGVQALAALGVRHEIMGRLEYGSATVIATASIALMFFALYKFLPNRPIQWQPAAVGAVVTTIMLQIAKVLFDRFLRSFSPGSLYAGTLYAIVIVVFWVYYAALIFLLGGEVGQVYDIRRAMRLQRETFED